MATALEALYLSLGTDRFLDVEINMQTSDADLDLWCSDAAKYAAIVCVEQDGEESSSAERRQVFWEWWLTEAISIAIRSCNFEGSTSYNVA